MLPSQRSRHFTIYFILVILCLFIAACSTPPTPAPSIPATEVKPEAPVVIEVPLVRSGLEVFLNRSQGFDSSRYALLTNQTAVDRDLKHAAELLPQKIDLRLLLSPEHGLFGAETAGGKIDDEVDSRTGILVKTTYRKKPPEIAELITDVDIVLFDIQDIGVRSYTYIYSMAYLMKAAAIAGKKVMILDRPNPVNGRQVEGNILDPEVSSFVGMYPIPYRHGMTAGELALYFNQEFDINCDLEVVPLEGWTRDMWFDETGLPWVITSPHVPDAETILPMIATGTYGELGMLSEGVGITVPFEFAGGPWIKEPHVYAKALEARSLPGVTFRPTFFKPYYGRHKGETCGGVQLHVTDRETFRPYVTGLVLMSVHQEIYPEIDLFENEHRWNMFAKVTGSKALKEEIQSGKDPLEMELEWGPEIEDFLEKRQKYLLYD